MPTGVTAECGNGLATVSWQKPGNGPGVGNTGSARSAFAAGVTNGSLAAAGGGVGTQADNGAAAGNLVAGAGTLTQASQSGATDEAAAGLDASEYEVGWTLEGEDWSLGDTLQVADLSATVPDLGNGSSYQFRVRAALATLGAAGPRPPSLRRRFPIPFLASVTPKFPNKRGAWTNPSR